jgi:hypothetical protein
MSMRKTCFCKQEEERREVFDIHMYGERVKTIVARQTEEKNKVCAYACMHVCMYVCIHIVI